MKSISIIIPVHNEQDSVKPLHQELLAACRTMGAAFEIIFVDDGSDDGTTQVIKSLCPATLIRLRRNFGQTAALDAGIRHASHDYIITIDGDGQNDPSDIPRLIAHLEENQLDVVCGWRKRRKDHFWKRFSSKGARWLRKTFIKDGIKDSGCQLKAFTRESLADLSLFGEVHRFIPAMLHMRGYKIGEIPVNHRHRFAGKTKYGHKRVLKGFLDMISMGFWAKYSVRPLHLFGGAGLVFLLLGVFSGAYALYEYFGGQNMSDSAVPLLTAFLMITGIQLLLFGLMSDMISKIYYNRFETKTYHVHEIIENKADADA